MMKLRNFALCLALMAPVAAKADRAIKPISIALGMFGGVALLAALLIATQSISRRLRSGADELTVLRALGADPVTTTADGLIGILGAIIGGWLAGLLNISIGFGIVGQIVIAFAGALILLIVWRILFRRKGK